jgi:hypothetical protein
MPPPTAIASSLLVTGAGRITGKIGPGPGESPRKTKAAIKISRQNHFLFVSVLHNGSTSLNHPTVFK